MKDMKAKKKGFTLIELLIVVAIIGILAAIAIPNFLQAQIRAKVAKAQADMRTIATALETFRLDNGIFPVACNINIIDPNGNSTTAFPYYPIGLPPNTCGAVTGDPNTGVSNRFNQLTTPIDYMTYNFADEDPFVPLNILSGYDSYDYWSVSTWKYAFGGTHPNAHPPNYSRTVRGAMYRMASAGPDRIHTFGGPSPPASADNPGWNYDPTNGTVSKGDIVRVGDRAGDDGSCMYPDKVFPCW